MNLKWPVPNVTCSCGQILYKWEEVVEHFQRHRDTQDHMTKLQQAIRAEMEKPAPRWHA